MLLPTRVFTSLLIGAAACSASSRPEAATTSGVHRGYQLSPAARSRAALVKPRDGDVSRLRGGAGYFPKLDRERANHALALRLTAILLGQQALVTGGSAQLRLRGGGGVLRLRGGVGYFPKLDRERANHALALRLTAMLLGRQALVTGGSAQLRLRGGGGVLRLRGGVGYFPKLDRERANHALALRLTAMLLGRQALVTGDSALLRLRGGARSVCAGSRTLQLRRAVTMCAQEVFAADGPLMHLLICGW